MNGSVVSEIRGSVLIHDDQKIQDVINGCTPLVFNIIFFRNISTINIITTAQNR